MQGNRRTPTALAHLRTASAAVAAAALTLLRTDAAEPGKEVAPAANNINTHIGLCLGTDQTNIEVVVRAVHGEAHQTAYLVNGASNNGHWYQWGLEHTTELGYHIICQTWDGFTPSRPAPLNFHCNDNDHVVLALAVNEGIVSMCAINLERTNTIALAIRDPGARVFRLGINANNEGTSIMTETWSTGTNTDIPEQTYHILPLTRLDHAVSFIAATESYKTNGAMVDNRIFKVAAELVTNKPPYDFTVGYDHLRGYTREPKQPQAVAVPAATPGQRKP